MFEITSKQIIAENTKRIEVVAPLVASKARPGQFCMVMTDKDSPRIALTIIDSDPKRGLVTLIFQEINAATIKLGELKISSTLYAILGPLGRVPFIKNFGTAVCVGYEIGSAEILPVCRALRKSGNKTIGVIGAKSKKTLLLESQMRINCQKLIATTDDGSYMRKGSILSALEETLASEKVNVVFAMAPLEVLKDICDSTIMKKIKTFVGLHPPMVDGFGLCGSCRVKVGKEEHLCCVEGPYFDGQDVDFQVLISKNNKKGR